MLANSKAFSGFSTNDPAAARAFYAEVLGVRTEDGAHGSFWLKLAGDRDVLVYPTETHTPGSYTVLNFPVPDIEAAVDELTARGVGFLHYEGDMAPDAKGIFRKGGPLIAWFTDPSGNVLSVLESTEEPS